VLEPIKRLLRSPRPQWACEFTSAHVVVAGVDAGRRRVAGKAAVSLGPESLAASLSERNLVRADAVEDAMRQALHGAGARGFEICAVIPDEAARIAFLTTESPPSKPAECEAFVRWKLKKSVPFDADTAQLAYRILGPAAGDARGVDMMVALSPRAVVREYEDLLERLGFHAGYVVPSTLAAGSLVRAVAPGEDALLVKLCSDGITTTVFQNRHPRFFRRVGAMPAFDAVYPTLMYYQDKLGGRAFAHVWVCGYDREPHAEIEELRDKLGVAVKRMDPHNVEDLYKPALGALDYAWADSI
jgi:hypothetical protein